MPSNATQNHAASAPGKIILCGEHAVVYGTQGIAMPSSSTIDVSYEPGDAWAIQWSDVDLQWIEYAHKICTEIAARTKVRPGTITVRSALPLGKGMGSSTALIIAMCRAVLGPECEQTASDIEQVTYPARSGLDFAVIWEGHPVLFRKGEKPKQIELPIGFLDGAFLIDTGKPNETTKELVAWVGERKHQLQDAFALIAGCAQRVQQGEDRLSILRDHHHAQVELGVVPEDVQLLIAQIEQMGGAAKVCGAGARTGGGGIVLAVGVNRTSVPQEFPTFDL